jgi:hypothetical protein
LSEFQRAIDPTLKTYKQPATLRFEGFTCGAILGRSGHHLAPAGRRRSAFKPNTATTAGNSIYVFQWWKINFAELPDGIHK